MSFVGQKIKTIRNQTYQEMNSEGWDSPATVIELENGALIYPSRDDEGNGAGVLFGVDENNEEQYIQGIDG